MDLDRIEAVIEAVLFTMGDSVEVEKLAAAIEHDVDTTRKIVHNMMDRYEAANRGIRIIELENAFQLCTKTEYYDELIKVASQPRKYVLTDVLLETLSIIAYKQPITKLEIEKIRGVSCDHAVNKLVEYGLAKELGRLDAPGRPMLFGTTEDFLRSFGVQSIDELPVISEDLVEKFKDEAQMELEAQQRDLESSTNFANPDMVGHTGIMDAVVKAIETVDECVGKVVEAVKEVDGVMFICADHGNAEKLIDDNGEPYTAHTTNPVPFILVNYDEAYTLKENGKLCDIIPTLIDIMELEKPAEMTGESLLIKK